VIILHKSKGSLTGEGKGQPKGWPPGTKAWEKRDEVFIVLFDYSVGVMR